MASVPIKYLPNLSVPFRADVDMGTCWGDMRTLIGKEKRKNETTNLLDLVFTTNTIRIYIQPFM